MALLLEFSTEDGLNWQQSDAPGVLNNPNLEESEIKSVITLHEPGCKLLSGSTILFWSDEIGGAGVLTQGQSFLLSDVSFSLAQIEASPGENRETYGLDQPIRIAGSQAKLAQSGGQQTYLIARGLAYFPNNRISFESSGKIYYAKQLGIDTVAQRRIFGVYLVKPELDLNEVRVQHSLSIKKMSKARASAKKKISSKKQRSSSKKVASPKPKKR